MASSKLKGRRASKRNSAKPKAPSRRAATPGARGAAAKGGGIAVMRKARKSGASSEVAPTGYPSKNTVTRTIRGVKVRGPKKRLKYEIRWVLWKDLDPAGWNPQDRSSGLDSLAGSLDDFNVITPISVNSKLQIINGHRRWLALGPDGLDWTYVPVMVSPMDQAEGFRESNKSKNIGSKSTLEIYCHGGAARRAITFRSKQHLERLEQLVGLEFMKLMVSKKAGPGALRVAEGLGAYLGNPTDAFLTKAIRWMVITKSAHAANRAPMFKMPRAKLNRFIGSNKQLTPLDFGGAKPVARQKSAAARSAA